jgi:Glyoxalase-like domain
MGLHVDHIIYAVRDLDAAASRFEHEFGFGWVEGGRHLGWGTANRIVPLGRSYVELVAVVDASEAAGSTFGRWVGVAARQRDRLLAWALATSDIEDTARRLNLPVTPGSRTRPDGVMVKWRLAGLHQAITQSVFPFLIQWDSPPELHPGMAMTNHRVTPRGIGWVEVAADEHPLRHWLRGLEEPVRINTGVPRLSAVGIATEAGEIVLR